MYLNWYLIKSQYASDERLDKVSQNKIIKKFILGKDMQIFSTIQFFPCLEISKKSSNIVIKRKKNSFPIPATENFIFKIRNKGVADSIFLDKIGHDL